MGDIEIVVFCNTMAKSIVDHTKVTINELLYMITKMVGEENSDKIKAFAKELREVWDSLEDKSPHTVLMLANSMNMRK